MPQVTDVRFEMPGQERSGKRHSVYFLNYFKSVHNKRYLLFHIKNCICLEMLKCLCSEMFKLYKGFFKSNLSVVVLNESLCVRSARDSGLG